jgi:hypothetical protein
MDALGDDTLVSLQVSAWVGVNRAGSFLSQPSKAKLWAPGHEGPMREELTGFHKCVARTHGQGDGRRKTGCPQGLDRVHQERSCPSWHQQDWHSGDMCLCACVGTAASLALGGHK